MLKRFYTCDHCGRELNEMIDFPDMDMDDLNEYFGADLCRDCYMELTEMVMHFCGKHPKEEV